MVFIKFILFSCILCSQNIVLSNIIFANTKELNILHLDSTRLDTSIIVDNLGDATALDFYFKEKIIFWSDAATEKIQGVRLTNKSKPFDIVYNGISSPDGLACDWVTKKIYWSDADSKRIEVVQFDGRNRKVLFWRNIDAPRAVALVPQDGLLFWTDWGDKPKIERSSMDGKNRKVLVNEELRWPNGLAVDFDAKRIYWTDGKLKYISSVDYNGEKKKMFQTNIAQAFGLTIDKDLLYLTDWTNMGISSCHKTAGKCKMLIPSSKHQSNSGYPSGIKVFSPTLQPEVTSNCNLNNGGCSNLCLLSSDPPYYSCACPTGILLKNDNKTCAEKEEKFIILLRRTDIRKISLDTDDHNDVVLNYPKDIEHGVSIDYDPVDDRIYWTDDETKTIRRAYLNSSRIDEVINSDLDRPDGIAVDWISKNLYWSEGGSKTIKISRIDGSYRKTIISKDLDKPRAIVVNPWKGLMFWTDWGSDPKIERASLDGSDREKIIFSEIIWPNGLAMDLDEEKLFWGDAKMDRIETCDFNGGSRKLLLDKVSHPFGITVLDNYVYWTDWHERAIHRTNKHIGGKKEIFLDSIADMMGLKAISLNQDLGFDSECTSNNGGCKHLCIDRYPKGFTCACADGWELDTGGKSCKRLKITTPLPETPRKSLKTTTYATKACSAHQLSCLSGEILCVDATHRCDGFEDCPDGSDEINCDKNLQAAISPLSSSSSTSLPPSSSTSTINNILKSTSGLPLYGVASAVCIVLIIFLLACRMTAVYNKEPSSNAPLIQQNLPSNAARMSTSVMPVYEPQPDLVSSYYGRDSTFCDSNSVCSGNESLQTFLCVPPPSPVTNVSVASYATKSQSNDYII